MRSPSFLLAIGILGILSQTPSIISGKESEKDDVRLARLKSSDKHWDRHSKSDASMIEYARQLTNLNVESRWGVADVKNYEEMSSYPFLFTCSTHFITDPTSQKNVSDYLRRGGFLLIDACINTQIVNPDPDVFLNEETKSIATILPDAKILPIASDHDIFTSYFSMTQRPPHTYMNANPNPRWKRHGLYGVYVQSRMVAIISLSGLECGWDKMPGPKGHTEECIRMFINIYIYAMTH